MPPLTPSHRSRNEVQLEVCELCGRLVGNSRLTVADVEGLRGFKICDNHGPLLTTPSSADYVMFAPLEIPDLTERVEPIGGAQWWEGSVAEVIEPPPPPPPPPGGE